MSLSRNPQPIDGYTWYYEETNGLNVVHEIRDADGTFQRTDQFIIPWKMITKSLKRRKEPT